MSGATKKLVVCGGSGFLGSRICKAAVSRGWDVTSISRSGQPQWQNVTASSSPPAWAHRVSWERADIFRPAQYAALLTGADFVVHSMGILLEADYKGVLSGRESPISGLQKAFSASKGRPLSSSSNPLHQEQQQQQQSSAGSNTNPATSSSSSSSSSETQLTYEMMNRDSAILLAKEAAREKVRAFGYVSAAGGAPVLPARYITTKREAEDVIAGEFGGPGGMRGVFFRPPFMYDSSRALTMPLAGLSAAGAMVNGLTGGILGGFLGTAVVKPLKADLVADAVVEALDDESVRGPVEVAQLEELGNKSWRKTMV